VIFCTTIKCCD